MAQIENLWGEIPLKGNLNSPKSILDQQASYLTQMTKKVLVGEVRFSILPLPSNQQSSVGVVPYNNRRSNKLSYELVIKAPTIGYQFVLLSMQHELTGYPVKLVNELSNDRYEIKDENSFKACLSEILSSDITQRAIQTLLSQSA